MSNTYELLGHKLEVIDIKDFKKYYEDYETFFTVPAKKSFLKCVDIPPTFFFEQPDETQAELLENRDKFVKEKPKYSGKSIIVLWRDNSILNACKMSTDAVENRFEMLNTFEDFEDRLEHRTFYKDGFVTYLLNTKDVKEKKDNPIYVIDFPIMLNKEPVIHEAYYRMANSDEIVPIDHISYVSSETICLEDGSYQHVKLAIDDYIEQHAQADFNYIEDKPVLRENNIIAISLAENGIIPKSYISKVEGHINSNVEAGLTTHKLLNLVTDYDQNFKGIKQVTKLRELFEKMEDVINIEVEEIDTEVLEKLESLVK